MNGMGATGHRLPVKLHSFVLSRVHRLPQRRSTVPLQRLFCAFKGWGFIMRTT